MLCIWIFEFVTKILKGNFLKVGEQNLHIFAHLSYFEGKLYGSWSRSILVKLDLVEAFSGQMAGFPFWKFCWGGDKIPPPLVLMGGGNMRRFLVRGKHNFTNLMAKNT